MSSAPLYWWYKIPFGRLVFCLAAGIILHWYLQLSLLLWLLLCAAAIIFFIIYSALPLQLKFRYNPYNGAWLQLLVVSLGALLSWENDIKNHPQWIGKSYSKGDLVMMRVEEPLVEKTNSYKAVCNTIAIGSKELLRKKNGKVIVYFKKEAAGQVQYGSQIFIKKELQEIRNSGNPGSFDFKRYCLFNGITHQVYLTEQDFFCLPRTDRNLFYSKILDIRQWVISVMRRFINGQREQGLAEALLIGYKDDLDKNLVQSYVNTGVVHVIAISGLHLGLIYWLLLMITKPIQDKKGFALLRLLVILSSLWLFSILAGAQPSVLRSSVMFSFMAWGSTIGRKTSVYNSLALSAFVLLVYQPYWLWDVGFQLSYAAVLSIVSFFKPVNNWFYFNNKILDFTWKLLAVTLSAQLLTLPVSIYHFHQFPTLFLFTNIVAVPLSSMILMGEIFLCAIYFLEPLAIVSGDVLSVLIRFMNEYIENMDSIPFAVWEGIYISLSQAIILSIFIISSCFTLIEKTKLSARLALLSLLLFLLINSFSLINAQQQKKIIVYNVPRQTSIDVIDGRKSYYYGDTIAVTDPFLRNFHIQPSRIKDRIIQTQKGNGNEFNFHGTQVCILDSTIKYLRSDKAVIDLLVLSKTPELYLKELTEQFLIRKVIIDASVPAWKSRLWKKDCDAMKIPCHVIQESGAFILEL